MEIKETAGKIATNDVIESFRRQYPYGHEKFLEIAVKEAQLHSDKNHDYAKGGDALGNFKRVGAILAQYPGLDASDPKVVAITYALKQLDAVLWGLCQKITDYKVEGFKERLQDVSVYTKLVMCMLYDEAREGDPNPWTK